MGKLDARGQVLALVIVILLVVSTLVPLLVFYTQREANWTAKQASNTYAFHLAEAGIEKAYLALSLSTQTWVNLQAGTLLTNYKFDKVYSDLSGGTYAVSITSGPGVQQATVISIGRDTLKRETRAIKAVYSNSPLGGIAIYSGAGAKVDNKVTVEWGSVVSPQNLTLTGAATTTHPQFHSAGSIDVFNTNPNSINCDQPNCCQWHTFSKNIPASPLIDLNLYKSSATAQTGCPTGTPTAASPTATSCYYPGTQSWSNATVSGGQSIYIDGNLNLSSPGIDIIGNLIVMGNLTTTSGNWGKGNHDMTIPQDAWKQYCNDWTYYRTTFDGAAAATFPGLNSSYLSATTLTYNSKKLAVMGLLYVQGSMSVGTGNGGSDINGVMYVVNTTTMAANSAVTLFYNQSASSAIQTTQIVLSRSSWQDVLYQWPAALP